MLCANSTNIVFNVVTKTDNRCPLLGIRSNRNCMCKNASVSNPGYVVYDIYDWADSVSLFHLCWMESFHRLNYATLVTYKTTLYKIVSETIVRLIAHNGWTPWVHTNLPPKLARDIISTEKNAFCITVLVACAVKCARIIGKFLRIMGKISGNLGIE